MPDFLLILMHLAARCSENLIRKLRKDTIVLHLIKIFNANRTPRKGMEGMLLRPSVFGRYNVISPSEIFLGSTLRGGGPNYAALAFLTYRATHSAKISF